MEDLPILSMWTVMVVAAMMLIVLVLLLLIPKRSSTSKTRLSMPSSKNNNKNNKSGHAVITGGTSGIGLAIAKECIRRNLSKITLIARNVENLEKQKIQLEAFASSNNSNNNNTMIRIISVDVTDSKQVQQRISAFLKSDPEPPSLLFNNAGTSSSSAFVDTPDEEFNRLIQINYLGCVHVTRAFLPHMIKQQDTNGNANAGSVVFTSSAAGQVGVYGYTAYSPTKAALKGFAESLQMEVRRNNIAIILAFPPDTDTPGYKLEQTGKPIETHLISEATGLFEPQDIAKQMVSAALQKNPPFNVYFGLEGWMLSTLTAGMSPVHNVFDAFCQVALMGILRFVSLFYLFSFHRIIWKCSDDREKQKND